MGKIQLQYTTPPLLYRNLSDKQRKAVHEMWAAFNAPKSEIFYSDYEYVFWKQENKLSHWSLKLK